MPSSSITISTISGDDVLNAAEAGSVLPISGTTSNVADSQTVTVDLNSKSYTTTVTGGAWTLNVPITDLTHTSLPDARYIVTANVTDSINGLAQTTRNLTVDETAPAVTAVLTSDTGTSSSDAVTKIATLHGTGDANTVVTLTEGASPLGTTTANGAGAWSLTPSSLTDGAHTIIASETDAAGNTGTVSVAFTLDTMAPGAPSAPVLAAASDSGVSSTDDITNVGRPIFTGTGEDGATATLLDGTTTIGTGTVTAGAWSITAATALSQGSNSITATQTDVAGNTSSASTALNVNLDTTAPAAPGVPVLAAASDSGVSSSDDITNVGRPIFTGTGEDGATVTLLDGTTTIGTGTVTAGAWSITAATALSQGSNSITATQTDVAGNTSGASTALNVTLDTTPPAAPTAPVLAAASDSGISTTDDITNVGLPSFTGTGEDGATVTLFDSGTILGSGTVSAGTWSITAATTLSEGTNSITATQTDVAGNTSSASTALNVTLDTTPPAAPGAPVLAAASDSGASNADNITNVGRPSFSGTGENGATVTLLDGSTTIGIGTVSAGTWSITATTTLSEGTNSITATQTDVAGNPSSASTALNVTLDTTPPAAPSAPVLAAASDSGASNADNITNVGLPSFTGTGEDGATVTLLDGGTIIGSGMVSAGAWSITATTRLSEGANRITATQTDVAGNTSSASSVLNVTLDTTPPAAPSTPDLLTLSDTGASSTDNITNVTLPIFSGTGENGATVTLLDGSTTIGTATVSGGTWAILSATPLSEGANSITATQTDVAGNISVASSPLSVTLDTIAPAVTAFLTIDTGALPHDSVTNTAALNGTGDANAVVTFTEGVTQLGTTTADSTGAWSYTPVLTDGAHSITASETDTAGNSGSASIAFTLDTAAPVVTAALTSDTGASPSDKITNDARLHGTSDANAVVTLTEGGATLDTVTADGSGRWSSNPLLNDGAHTITASETDTAGNTGSAVITFTLDSTAPAAPSTPDLLAASDSGASSTDNITNVGMPSFSGTGENGATVTLLDGSTTIGTGTVSAGNWSITATTALHQGANSITATQTDVAGNTSGASTALNVMLDTAAPAAPSTPDLLALSDSGASSTDNITKVSRPIFNGIGENGATVTLLDGTTTIGTGTVTGGTWSITATTPLSEGANSITAKQTDVAGNISSASSPLSVTLDTTAPAVTAALTSDTGVSLSDSVTKNDALNGTGDANAVVTLKEGATTLGTTPANGTGAWSFTPSSLTDGAHTITASETDAAGNTGSSSVTFTLDTIAPAAPSTPDLLALSDSGASTTDNITNLGLPSFSGTGEAGATVTLLDGGATIGTGTVTTGGTWSITTATALHEGTNSIAATQTDVAGNTSSASTSLSVTLDTTAPVVTAALTSDTGASSSDAVTRNDALSGTGDANAVVTLTEGGTQLGTTTADGTGAWNFAPPSLTDGMHTVIASETDTAGNTGTVSVAFTLDTAALAPSTPDLLAASDSGASSTDNITKVSLPSFSGTGENGATVTLVDSGTIIGTGTVTGGNWSITATTALSQGANSITATQTDVAGNTSSASAALNVTLDTIAPTAPSAPVLAAASDSGASSTDNITNVGLPSFSGTGENGATVTLLDSGTLIGTGTVTAGAWSISAATPLTEGANSITATQTDVAGNISSASTALNVTLDTAAPAAPSTPDLLAASDSGASSTDNITKVSLPSFSGTGENGATVTLLDSSTIIGTGTVTGGNWSITATTALSQGANSITATQTDVAGNTSSASAALNVTLDTIAPTAPSAPVLAAASDSGASSTDNITNVGLPSFSGTGENGATVTLLDSGTLIGTGTVTAGAWSISAATPLTEGANSITATQTDVAGNISSASTALNVTLDTAAPAAPSKPDLLTASDSGASSTDNITNVSLPIFTGTGENGATVTLLDSSTIVGTGTVTAGTWSITAATALIEGTNRITATQTDVAGNTSIASTPLNVTLDTTAPAVTAALTSDTGASSHDSVTRNAALRGTGDANATVTLMEGATTLGTTTANGTGAWSFMPMLLDGAHTITASETDAAGNTGSASIFFNLDTTPPGAPSTPVLAASSDSGASSTDDITNVSLPSFSGTGENGATVTLFDGNTTIGTGRVSGGNWSITAATALIEGTNSITAKQTDLAGNVSTASMPLVATLDTVAPTVTEVTASPSDATVQVGQTVSFTVGLSEAVTVNATAGEPTLSLSDGATATYVSGSDTDALTFSYTVAAGQAATDLAVTGVDLNGSTITDAAGNAADLTGAASDPPGTLTIAGVAPVAEFDAAYYLANNPDVAAAGVDPAEHYATIGWKEGRNPDAFFNTDYYLNQNPDVAAAGIDPLTHYDTIGWKEGRDPSADFSTDKYLQANPDVAAAGIDPLLHYLEYGAPEGRMAFIAQPHGVGQQNPLVDNTYYFAQNPDVRAAGVNPFTQYDTFGWHEGRNPDALFNTTYYLQQNPDVAAAGVDPLLHYEQYGWLEGRNPSPDFSTNAYLNANPDVKSAGINPLVQYEEFGMKEGRAIFHV
ncbi:Ig-like domain-containing protein [Rhodopila sp.]|uniref:Ig-like domain-containing protein n=1 Tax=Rhodopila sp. TaxID=2480087 RepID=UPI003D0CFB66